MTLLKYNAVSIKATTPHRFRLIAVRCRTLWTVNCTTAAPSTRLSATTPDVITPTDNGLNASNRKVLFSPRMSRIAPRVWHLYVHGISTWRTTAINGFDYNTFFALRRPMLKNIIVCNDVLYLYHLSICSLTKLLTVAIILLILIGRPSTQRHGKMRATKMHDVVLRDEYVKYTWLQHYIVMYGRPVAIGLSTASRRI